MQQVIHYALILDQSGSMESLKKEVISSFGEQVEMIRKLQKDSPEAAIKVTLCVFNDTISFKFLNANAEALSKLSPSDYQPQSVTALYDAMGKTMNVIDELAGGDDRVFLAIFTDGHENASSQFSAHDIQVKLAEAQKRNWNIRFFCRHEDNAYYSKKLNINAAYMRGIPLNEDGLDYIKDEVQFNLEKLINDKDKQ